MKSEEERLKRWVQNCWEGLHEHSGIILEALGDYKRWFDDIEKSESDIERIKQIDKAIEFVENIEQNV